MPRSPEAQRAARAERRRREAAAVLRLAADLADYAARQVSDGLAPAEARQVLVEASGELTAAAISLRRLARLGRGEARGLALCLTAEGVSAPEIAARLGISQRSVYRYRAAASRQAAGALPAAQDHHPARL